MISHQSKRVVVAMSGGVDSSVAALLLREAGYQVIGISLKLWDYDEPDRKPSSKTCCSYKDIRDAGDVCASLNIPFYSFNYKDHFKQNVIDSFVADYKSGITPNPCVLCNQHVKFDRLLVEAEKLGASYLATGHYARIRASADQSTFHLLKGVDPAKDQSYVLYGLNQKDLAKILLPIGEYTKEQIRDLARQFGLPTADKHESQDICFVPNNDYTAFITKHYPDAAREEGDFVDIKGNVLGRHRGIHAYTVGQRRGLGVAMGERYYVVRIDADKNEVVLGDHHETLRHGCVVKQMTWVLPTDKLNIQNKKIECGVKVRYQKDEFKVVVEVDDLSDQVRVVFDEPHSGITPGQFAVFYRDDEVLGGGRIIQSF